MRKFVAVHQDYGIYVAGYGFQTLCFTNLSDPDSNGSKHQTVSAFDDEKQAASFLNQVLKGHKVLKEIGFLPVEIDNDIRIATFEDLRKSNLGRFICQNYVPLLVPDIV